MKKYKYATRVVTPLKDTEEVDKELDYIFKTNNNGEDIVSIQVIPQFQAIPQFPKSKYPFIPTFFVISYIYRYEPLEDDE